MLDAEILNWLKEENPEKCKELFDAAYQVKIMNVGKNVFFRGIIELSNICSKNCFYCGIRRDSRTKRYQMTMEEVCQAAQLAFESGYGSLVIQAGEQTSKNFVDFVSNAIQNIKGLSGGKLGITLSLGEQTKEVYQRWFDLGAHRYLLRIETSNETLYKKLHPGSHSFKERLQCLKNLQEIGYQAGTGVMIGLPHQKNEDLFKDLCFFRDFDIDMIGMGPYIPHDKTPFKDYPVNLQKSFLLSLKMVALLRIMMPDINIAATTAMQAIDPEGREKALQAGANIIMPNITPSQYRSDYQLYNNKPCITEDSSQCLGCLSSRIETIGEKIGYHQWGDSPHFKRRKETM